MTKDNDESVIVFLINDEVRPSVALYSLVWQGGALALATL
jgi:hypothetical protein